MRDIRTYSDFTDILNEVASDVLEEIKDEATELVIEGEGIWSMEDDIREQVFEFVDREFIHTDIQDHAAIIQHAGETETDSGLWEGQAPEEAIQTMAFFTFEAEVYMEVIADYLDYLRELLDETDIELAHAEAEDEDDKDEDKIEELEERYHNIQDAIEE